MVRRSVSPKDVNRALFHSKHDLTAKEEIWDNYLAQETTDKCQQVEH